MEVRKQTCFGTLSRFFDGGIYVIYGEREIFDVLARDRALQFHFPIRYFFSLFGGSANNGAFILDWRCDFKGREDDLG